MRVRKLLQMIIAAAGLALGPLAVAVGPAHAQSVLDLPRQVERLTADQVRELILNQSVRFGPVHEATFNSDGTYYGECCTPQMPPSSGRWSISADGTLTLVADPNRPFLAGSWVLSRDRNWIARQVAPTVQDPVTLSFNGGNRNPF